MKAMATTDKPEEYKQTSESNQFSSDVDSGLGDPEFISEPKTETKLSPSVYVSSDAEPILPPLSTFSLSADEPAPLASLHISSDFESEEIMSQNTASDMKPVSSILSYTSSDIEPELCTSGHNTSDSAPLPSPTSSSTCNPCQKKSTNQTVAATWYCHQCDDLLCQDCKSDHEVLKLASDHVVETLHVSCDLCTRKKLSATADWWCYDCDDFLCSDCRSKHKLFKPTEDHSIFHSQDKIKGLAKQKSGETIRKSKSSEESKLEEMGKTQAKLLRSFRVDRPADTAVPSILSSVVLSDGTILLLDVRNNCIKMFDETFCFLELLKFNERPSAVGMFDKSEIAVTLQNGTFTRLSADMHKLRTKKTVSTEFSSLCPMGIDYINRDQLVVSGRKATGLLNTFWQHVVGTVEYALLVCSIDGVKQTIIETDSVGNSLFCTPFHVKVDRQREKIYVSNGDSSTVCCLDAKCLDVPRVEFKFQLEDLQHVRGLDIDEKGNIYICGASSRNIHQISPDGKYIKTLLTKHDGLNRPITMSFTPSGDTFIVGSSELGDNSMEVQVFKMQ